MRFCSLTRPTLWILLPALFWAISALAAEMPREALERLAEINVEIAENRHLNSIGKLTDAEHNNRGIILHSERRQIWYDSDVYTQDAKAALITIEGLTRAKLSLLEPRWEKEQEDLRKAGKRQLAQTFKAVETDSRRAVEFQRQRFLLQQQLDRGAIDRDTFTAKDREAQAAISDLRKKFETAGGSWPQRFDQRLTYLTRQLANNPDALQPRPRIKPPAPPRSRVVEPPRTQIPQQPPPPRRPVISLAAIILYGIWGFVGLLLVAIVVMALRKKQPTPDGIPPLTNTYGTAKWADYQENPASPTVIARGVFFGKSSLPGFPAKAYGAPITSLPEAHTLIVARTRAGKGTRVIVPTLLRYDHSMLVIDPKGENAAITARTRRDQLKHTVHIINPWEEMKALYSKLGFETATFNPLDAIDRNDPNAVAVAQSLAATICPVMSDKDKFWQGSAANVLAAVLLWITDQPTEQKTLARARELITKSREDFKKNVLAPMMTSTAFHGAIKELVSQYYDLAPETYSGIMSNLAESTKFLSDPQIKASTGSSSFSMQSIRDALITVYIVIPHDRIQTHSTWLRLVIASAMQAIKNRSRIKTPPHHRCMFLIDEFGSIGHIADVPRDIAMMSGYGLDFTLIVQGLDQLQHHYGDAKGTILNNCGYKWFCYVSDLETAKYLSESLGKTTVRTVGKSKSASVSGQGQTEGESTTYGETARALLAPDEVLNLGREFAILLNPLTNPHYLRPVDYWKLTAAFENLEGAHRQFYWMPPLAYDPNPYHNPPPPPPKAEAPKPPPPKPPTGGIGEEVF